MSAVSAERSLLSGFLALRMSFVSREQLVAALQAWVPDTGRSLVEVLVGQSALGDQDRVALDLLVERHLARHEEYLARGQSALPSGDETLVQDQGGRSSLGPEAVTTAQRSRTATAGRASAAGPAEGRYRALRLHAMGGLGQVSVALDEELNREVALKQIREQYADDAGSQARFVREAEITARLEHPGIVPVYGLDRDEAQRPRYAMRFIRGESLQDAIARFHQADLARRDPSERALSLRGLLRRFVDVCNAVAYAHAKGIIHRDLKPANVMLGDYGETLVVDWGLAKVLECSPPLHGGSSEDRRPGAGDIQDSTQRGQAVGTPAFIAPEQARGEHDRVDAVSDVFALGATLYCLLTGQPPYSGKSAVVLTRASAGATVPARQVDPRVPRALEAVCRKAMAPRREDRYDSARALADDVERFMADEKVSALREPVPARLRRWARRNRTVVTAAGVLLIASVVGLALGLWAVYAEKTKTARQRDQARANLARALEAEEQAKANLARAEANLKLARQAVDECFGADRSHPLLQAENLRLVRRLLLEKTLPFYRSFSTQKPDDPALAVEQADHLFRVAYITAEIASKANALASYEQAREILDGLVKGHPEVAEYQAARARIWNNLGLLHSAAGRQTPALDSYRQALKFQGKLTRAHPKVTSYRADLANTWNNLGILQNRMGQREEALRSFTTSLDLSDEVTKAHPKVPTYQADLARTLNNLGLVQRGTGRRNEALASFTRAREVGQKLTRAYPGFAPYQAVLASTWNSLGLLYKEAGQRPLALRSYEQARDLFLQLAKAHPEVTAYQSDLASTWSSLGTLQKETGKPNEALASFTRALDIRLKLAKAQPEVVAYRADLASTWGNLGLVQSGTGKPAEAITSLSRARGLYWALTKAHPAVSAYRVNLAGTCNNLGLLLSETGKKVEALERFAEAIDLLTAEGQRKPAHPSARSFLRNSHWGRAEALTALGRHHDALPDWERALALDSGPYRADLELHQALALARTGGYLRAVRQAEQLSRDASRRGDFVYNLARVHAVSARAAARDVARPLAEREQRAEQYARAALALLERARGLGYFKTRPAVERPGQDADLASLRDRDDFRLLLSRIAGKSQP
jgi:serine/threonine-protein kinase